MGIKDTYQSIVILNRELMDDPGTLDGLDILKYAIFFFVLVPVACAEENRFTSLIENSPFGSSMAAIVVAEPALEFRGYVYTDEKVIFSIACPDADGRLRSAWVEIDESKADCVVRSFDQASDAVDIEYRGHRLTLKLKRGRVQLLPSTEPTPAVSNQPSVQALFETNQLSVQTPFEIIMGEIRRQALRQTNAKNNDP